MRETPDPPGGMIVRDASGVPLCTHGTIVDLSRIGGTSVSSPTFAGIEADAQQAAGHDLGFANPVIYTRYGSSAFNDVTESPSPEFEVRNNFSNPDTPKGPLLTYLRAMGIDGQGAAALPATPGYDDSTGVGSPDQYIQSFFGY